MNIHIKTTPEELLRARKWWGDLEAQWKMVYNEALFARGPVLEPLKDEELMMLLVGVDTLRLAGPLAISPNTSVVLTNLSGLLPLQRLKYLSISNMKISSLEGLRLHTNLEYLYVYENKLTSIKGVEGMKNLKEFYFQSNEVEDLTPIKQLTNLEVVYASGNKIEKINGITTKHKKIKKFYILPNDSLHDREIIRIQNELGILCRQG
ncbi:MAG: leucine-rich repeat domain-containing protein [Bacteroidota bacterium]